PSHVLEDTAHLILELRINGRIVGETNLYPRAETTGIWDADQDLILCEADSEPILFVFSENNGEESQLLGPIQLLRRDVLAGRLEMPLTSTEDIVLKAKIETLSIGDLLIRQAHDEAKEEIEIENRFENALHQLRDFEGSGNLDILEQAISQFQFLVGMVHEVDPNLPVILQNLGICLGYRFKRLGNIEDLEGSIAQNEAAINFTPDSHLAKPNLLSNLGNSLMTRFQRLGNVDDITNAILRQQAAVELAPDDHPDKPGILSNLGNCLQTRFERFGNTADIDDAIARHGAAVSLTPDGDPKKPSRLNNLGNSLHLRFKRFGNIDDINSAIAQKKAAVNFTPIGHPDKPSRLNNLGASLTARFMRFKNVDDINSAITQQQATVDLSPDGHPTKPSRLQNLGNSLMVRFEHFKVINDIDRAIARQQASINLTPDGHPNKPSQLNSLGNAFLTRFIHYENVGDIGSAIEHLQAAVNLAPDDHPSKPGWLNNLGTHQHLARMGAIAQDAAAAAISLHQFDRAVEWLEQGRSIVWTQILQLRTPVDQLRDVDPRLANDLLRISRLLDSGTQDGEKLSSEEEGRRYRALAEKWEGIIKRVRELPDFEDFLRPPRFHRLLGAAKNGPVVVVNIAEERCDALALIDGIGEVMHIPLPDLTLEKATNLQVDLTSLLKSSNVRLRAVREPEFEHGHDGECKRILGELWNCLVKPVLDSLAYSAHPETLPRIWWCVTGPLAFLPIHAAGKYDEESTDGQIHDYVISSYSPTLTALLESLNTSADTPFKMLSVIEPSTGRWYIPNTKVELTHIQRHIKDRDHLVLEGPDATKERVIEAMRERCWLHLACHGSQNVKNPIKSGLKLRDGDLLLEEIIKLNLPRAEFAFLSACQTVSGDETLSEESVHIAGGMLLAGYRSVVATMWSIQDELAPVVADKFYAHLMKDGERPDSRMAAEALHESVQRLRRKPGISMVSWIPFVHLGI
ncbi:hypothetical protein FRC17_011248, partial [Serendipita sp. 399]